MSHPCAAEDDIPTTIYLILLPHSAEIENIHCERSVWDRNNDVVRHLKRMLVSATVIAVCAAGSVTMLAQSIAGTASASTTHVAEACHGHQLTGEFVRTGVWGGNLDALIFVTNVSDATCRLGGYPTLVGLRDNHKYPLRVTSHDVLSDGLAPATLQPRTSGALIIGTGDACVALNQTDNAVVAAAHSYTGLVLVLPDNGGSITVLGVNLDTACGLGETQLGWRTPFPMLLP